MQKVLFVKKPALNKGKLLNRVHVVIKHQNALKGTGFEDCAHCPGCPGRVEYIHDVHMMLCSRCGPSGMLVTMHQATACDGSKPLPAIENDLERMKRVVAFGALSRKVLASQ